LFFYSLHVSVLFNNNKSKAGKKATKEFYEAVGSAACGRLSARQRKEQMLFWLKEEYMWYTS